jgi:hypothetical protein
MNRRVIAKWAKTLDPFWTVGENLLVLQAEATKKKTSVTVRTDQIVTTLLFPSPTVIIIKPNAYGQVQILGWISYAKMIQKQKPDPKWSKMFWKFDIEKKLLWFCDSTPDAEMKTASREISGPADTTPMEETIHYTIAPSDYFKDTPLGVSDLRTLLELCKQRYRLLSNGVFCDAYRVSDGALLIGDEEIRDTIRAGGDIDWKEDDDLFKCVDPGLDHATFSLFRLMFCVFYRRTILYRNWWIEKEVVLFDTRLPKTPEALVVYARDHCLPVEVLPPEDAKLWRTGEDIDIPCTRCRRPDCDYLFCYFPKGEIIFRCSGVLSFQLLNFMPTKAKYVMQDGHLIFSTSSFRLICINIFRKRIIASFEDRPCKAPPRIVRYILRPLLNLRPKDPTTALVIPENKHDYVTTLLPHFINKMPQWYKDNVQWSKPRSENPEFKKPNVYSLYGNVPPQCRTERPCLHSVGPVKHRCPVLRLHTSNHFILKINVKTSQVWYFCFGSACKQVGSVELF